MQYFAVIAIPRQPFDAFEVQRSRSRPSTTRRFPGPLTCHNPAGAAQFGYLGPKEQSYLENVRVSTFQKATDYGMFRSWCGLCSSLKWMYVRLQLRAAIVC
jgi:hypothetical protein